MKRLMITLLLTLPLQVNAEEPKETPIGKCTAVAELAGVMAESRYAGIPITKLLNLDWVKEKKIYTDMVNEAYSLYAYVSPANQKRAVTEHINATMQACMKILSKDN